MPVDSLGDLRRRVVASVESGLAQVEAARRFGVSRQTVGVWVRDYRNRGEGAFRPNRRGRKPGERLALTDAQQLDIARAVQSGSPESAGLDCLVWNRQAVTDLVHTRFAMPLGMTTVGNYLVRWGFPLPQDLLRALRAAACGPMESPWLPGAEVVWVGHGVPTWCPDAPRTPVLQAVSNRGALSFLAGDPRSAEAVADFVARLVRQSRRRLNLVVTWPPTTPDRIPRLLTFDDCAAAITVPRS
ncbi:helix-turn-helix domain-containing protein [Actinokineospora fastidiosa]|uniref:helix-turn-helix domain-containing protein n=1 Tax=Actinokineospora fastidiosa TaxID=1816 RepID=UPI001670CAD2|nr:helix-turn-helix domain-containing protein [Actinokineospora fastidiosa]